MLRWLLNLVQVNTEVPLDKQVVHGATLHKLLVFPYLIQSLKVAVSALALHEVSQRSISQLLKHLDFGHGRSLSVNHFNLT